MIFAHSFLFVPGNREHMLVKSRTLDCDVVIFDLEDAVSADDKESALMLVSRILQERGEYPMQIAVRVNPGNAVQELAALAGLRFDMLVFPKAELTATDKFLADVKRYADGKKVLLLVETARGLVECYRSLGLSPLICGAMLGAEDFAADLGVRSTPEGAEISYARSVLAVACAARRMLAVDTPHTAVGDEAALKKDIETAKTLGMKAKAAIHPSQLSAIRKGFMPSADELQTAKELVAEAEKHGHNAFRFKGEMVDIPVNRQAQNLLRLQSSEGGEIT